MFRDIGVRQEQVYWRVRWVDQPEFVLILFSEVSVCICFSHISIQTVKIPPFLIGLEYYMWSLGQGDHDRVFPVYIV